MRGDYLPFLRDDALGRQTEDVEPSIADEAEIRGGGDGYPGVEEGGVFDGVAIEALGAELEHLGCRGVIEHDEHMSEYDRWYWWYGVRHCH